MKYLFICCLLICGVKDLFPQQFSRSTRPFAMDIMSLYENRTYNDSTSFSELTNYLWMSYTIERNTRISVTTRYASVGGDLDRLSGLSDTQVLISQYFAERTFGIEAGVNIPSGKTKLTEEEFLTSRVISQNIFGVNTSNFGQGLNMFFGLTWTQPFSDDFVFGAGLSYQIKNEYQPLKDFSDKYNPSNEISATAGFDVKLSEFSTLTGDFTGIFYQSDELNGQKVFTAGNRFIFNTLFRQYFGFNALSVNILYRMISVDKIEGAPTIIDNEKNNPNQFYGSLGFFHRFSSDFSINYSAFISLYQETKSFYSGYTMYGLGLTPEFRISPQIRIPILLRYSIGNASDKPKLNYFDIGGGLKFNF